MKNYEALDIETIWCDDIAKPICIAITSDNDIKFKKIDVSEINEKIILKFLLEECSDKKIYYVHNLTFEMLVFIRELHEENVKFKIVSANRTIYSAEIWYGNKRIRLRCSYRLTMLSLRKLAELADIDQKGIFPYKILNNDMKSEMKIKKKMFNNDDEYNCFIRIYGKKIKTYEILEEYCKNDALITKKSIIKFWNIIEEGGLKNKGNILTAAKLSIENYFMNNGVIKKKIKLKYDRIIRKAYYGGRCEVFGNPKNDEVILHYDWSGMYAQCMSEKVLGGEIIESNIIKSVKEPGFYWIRFRQNLEIPILPIKLNKLMFCNGEFQGWYWFEEILLAIEYGVEILSIDKVITSQYYDYFIKDFVEINNNIRKISPLHKQIGKNNNNTFYGRLGMDPERLEEEITNDLNGKYEKIIEINGIYIGYTKKEKSISNVSVSAAITSKARIKLYVGMMNVIKNGGRILYTDTDSIIASFREKEYSKIIDKHMGEVIFDSKKEDTVILDAVFALPKTYALKYQNKKEIVKIKGFNSVPSFGEFKEKFYNKETIITKNMEWSKKDLIIKKTKIIKKTNLNNLDKRNWDSDLKDTKPIYVP